MKTYKRGDKFIDSEGAEYMLCNVALFKYCLILINSIDGYDNGNRWNNPITIKNEIGEKELEKLYKNDLGITFKQLEK